MVIKTNVKNLKETIGIASIACARQSINECLKRVLVMGKAGKVMMYGSNGQHTICTLLKDATSDEEKMITLDPILLNSILSASSQDTKVSITLNEAKEEIDVKIGKSKLKLPKYIDDENYPLPELPGQDAIQFELDLASLGQIEHSIARDTTNPIFGCACVGKNESIYACSCDSHRFSIRGNYKHDEKNSYLMPLESVTVALKLFGEEKITVNASPSKIWMASGCVVYTFSLMNGVYFNMDSLKQNPGGIQIKFDRTELQKEMSAYLPVNKTVVTLKITDKGVTCKASNPGAKVYLVNQLSIKEKTEGTMAIGINPEFIIQALNSISNSTVTITFSSPTSPIYIDGDGYTEGILPIKIDEAETKQD